MLSKLNDFLWLIATFMIFYYGIYFSIKLHFPQFNIKEMILSLRKKGDGGISPIQTLTMTLAAKIGVGSISGIALAIYLGGPGTIFWMWITSLIASSNSFVESTLAVIFREKDDNNLYKGGPSFYISKGLGYKRLANIYALIIIIAFIGGFLSLQSNTIVKGLAPYFNESLLIGIILAAITFIVILKGVKRIALVTNYLVPIMGLFYLCICTYIIIINHTEIVPVFKIIVGRAIDIKSFGYGIISSLLIGMQRGIFSSEAGIGTGAIASGVSGTTTPSSQGFIQTFGVHLDTLLIGSLTAFAVLMSDYKSLVIDDANGIEIMEYAFLSQFGSRGSIFLLITIILFAFASIISGYYYGESALKFIKKNITKVEILILKLITVFVIIIGGLMPSELVIVIVDILVALLAIINIYSIYSLRRVLLK